MTHSVHTSTYELLPFEEYGNRIKSLSSSCDCINIFQVEVEDFDNEIFILSVDARDTYIEQLLPLLVQCEEWRDTEQYSFFASTLFPNITLTTLCGYHTHRWKHYLGLKHRTSFIERLLSEEYVSTEQMTALRNMHFLGTATPVQSIVIVALK